MIYTDELRKLPWLEPGRRYQITWEDCCCSGRVVARFIGIAPLVDEYPDQYDAEDRAGAIAGLVFDIAVFTNAGRGVTITPWALSIPLQPGEEPDTPPAGGR